VVLSNCGAQGFVIEGSGAIATVIANDCIIITHGQQAIVWLQGTAVLFNDCVLFGNCRKGGVPEPETVSLAAHRLFDCRRERTGECKTKHRHVVVVGNGERPLLTIPRAAASL
jgi:hypothetical protein